MQSSDDPRHRQIIERAYALWIEQGRPHGRDKEHWQAAEHQIAATEQASPGRFRKRRPRPRKPADLDT